MNCKFACLALTSYNRITLLDFPLDVGVSMRDAINTCYPFGVVSECQLPEGNLDVILAGWPWITIWPCTKGTAGYHAKAMLGRMMRIAEEHGWTVVMSADVSCKMEGPRDNKKPADVHTLYFMKVVPPS